MPLCWPRQLLRRITLNQVTRQVDYGRVVYLKRRHWYAELLIVVANIGFVPSFQVLPNRLWLTWEQSIYRRLYDLVAYWFDFETIYPSTWSPAWRQADDLRAFSCSAAAWLRPELYPAMANLVVAHCDDPAVLRALQTMIEQPGQLANPFYLGQTRLAEPRAQRWLDVLFGALQGERSPLADEQYPAPLPVGS